MTIADPARPPDPAPPGPRPTVAPPPTGDDALAALGLRPVELADAATFRRYFDTLTDPLSDYTFAQIYSWRNSLHLAWTEIAGHLCVFANGCGDLTLLVPPIGDTGTDAALRDAADLMDGYNAAAGVPDRTRVEYASDELLARLDPAGLATVAPMGTDYVYDTARMIDLAGGDLASKRQARNRFARSHVHRCQAYAAADHLDGCLALLRRWHARQDAAHAAEPTTNGVKRAKESIATELALRSAADLGLSGLVVYVGDTIAGFTLGEPLGADQSSIVIEKTDLEAKGLAQFIFSEFCRRDWSARRWCNVGDDWGLASLAWTKQSYRPVRLLPKYTLTPKRHATAAPGWRLQPPPAPKLTIRPATPADVPALVTLEHQCFPPELAIPPRHLHRFQASPADVCLVAEVDGRLVGDGVALVRRWGGVATGRVYSLAVDADHRRHGVGRRLLDALLDRLAAHGVARTVLEVDGANGAAVSLYERAGFVATSALPDFYGPGRDGLRMARDAAPATAAA